MHRVTETRPDDWRYLSEGGATVVFAYAGPLHPAFTGKVLRLRKSPGGDGQDDDGLVAFQNTVIAALVPDEHLPDLAVVLLDPDWLAALDLLRDHDRPADRRAAGHIDRTRQKGILATDLIRGTDVLAVEIKPKWGFMPNPAHLSRESAETKALTCRFCMHARLNAKGGRLPTQYCPLDLYSADEGRVRKAIGDLYAGWVQSDGQLNSMKVFISGQMIRPSESPASLAEFLSATADVHEALAAALLPSLRNGVLRTLSGLQRSLDALDIEGVARLHAMACPDADGLRSVSQNPSLEQLQRFAASYHTTYRTLDHSRLCPEHVDTYLIAYLLSATFKDCSLIFRIPRSGVASPVRTFIIDLDFKGVDRLEKWAELDRRIVEHNRETTVLDRKRCVE